MAAVEDGLLPLVYAMLRDASLPTAPQNPNGPTVLFGAFNPTPNSEVVGVTGLCTTDIERNREAVLRFDVIVCINLPGLNAAQTWERRSELTTAVLSAFADCNGTANLTDEMRDLGVYFWRCAARTVSLEPAGPATGVPGAGGWVGWAQLTMEAQAKKCC